MRSGKRWQAAVLATASLLWGAGCTPTGDKPNESTDSAGPETNPTVVAPADPAIANHFATMFEVGPDADARYQESLEQLRTVPGATEILISRYKALGDANPSERWQVVETLRALADPAALKFLVPLARSPAPVDDYQPGNNSTSGDTFYGTKTCNQAMVNQFWNHFDFDKGDWDDGFGFEAPCDLNRPLARTFNALYLLAYSAQNYATTTGDLSGNALRWGYPFAASNIDELDGRCGSGDKNSGARATTYHGAAVDDRTELKWPFFYGENVVERAGTIVHEARHANGKSHNAGTSCPRKASCDSEWSYMGANSYHVLYLWWFYVDGTRTTTAMKNFAKTEAQYVIDYGFKTRPPYTIY